LNDNPASHKAAGHPVWEEELSVDRLAARAAETPDRIALRMATDSRSLSFAQIDARADRIARALQRLGLPEGATIGLLLDNDLHVMEFWFGARRAGLYYVPISTRLLANEIAYILADSRAELLIASAGFTATIREVERGFPPETLRCLSTEAVIEAGDDAAPAPAALIGRELFYSSGTTGRPRGIRRPLVTPDRDTLPPLEQRMREICGYDRDTVYLSVAPLYHATGRFLIRVVEAGGSAAILPRFDPVAALSAIERHRVTHSQWVPTMFARMLDLPAEERQRHDLSSLRVALHAAAPCPMALKRAMLDWWGPIIDEYYGGSENAGITYISAAEWLERPGSVGRAIVGAIHILDEQDHARELPPGAIGLIAFEGGVPFQYTTQEGTGQSNASPQGYTSHGDIGHVDAEGYLFISDRRDDLILTGGVNVYPKEVELVLETHPAVREVAVIGLPDPDLGQRVAAVVCTKGEANDTLADALLAHCRAALSSVKCPRAIHFVDELPRNENGKLLKRVLRERFG
jgi:long-chain acyl-CoA synthetase